MAFVELILTMRLLILAELPSFSIYTLYKTLLPGLLTKNAIDNLNRVGLPVFLNPMIDITPIANPTKNPTRLSIFSNKNSNDV